MKIVDKVKEFVQEECNKPTSKYGKDPYKFHFVFVHDYAKRLAERLDADIEVVEIAAWLHDIGSIIYGRKDHHVTGAKIAEDKLIGLKYPKEKIELVKKCILNHRGSVKNERFSVEEQIIADADVMSHFDNLSGLFMAAFVYEGKDQGEARDSIKTKLMNSWNKLSGEGKELIKPKYEAAMLLLEELK